MPIHDWSRVEDAIFHAFHTAWIPELQKALNAGLLPEGYYALAEQHFGRPVADLLTLQAAPDVSQRDERVPLTPNGGIAVAEAPPKVQVHETIERSLPSRQRTLAVRHVSGHRLVALVEIVSRSNKDRARHVEEFTDKCVRALEAGVHLLMMDLFAPGPHDPHGLHTVIRRKLEDSDATDTVTPEEPVTLVSYAAGAEVEVYLEHLAVGASLPSMPLFLTAERYINAPLEATYCAAWEGMPAYWRGVLETQE